MKWLYLPGLAATLFLSALGCSRASNGGAPPGFDGAPSPGDAATPAADAGAGAAPAKPDSGTTDAGPVAQADAGTAPCAKWSDCADSEKCVAGACVPFRWTRLGPGGGGTMATPRLSPRDSHEAIVSCDMTGSYLTHNAGDSWDEFNVRTVLGDAAFDPTDSNVIYAASSGIFRSENGGRSFEPVFPSQASITEDACGADVYASHYFRSSDNWPGGHVSSIAVDPQDNQRLYAVINGNLWVSSNRGASWAQVGAIASGWQKVFVDTANVYYFSGLGIRRYDKQTGAVSSVNAPGGMADAAFGLDPSRPGVALFYAVANGALYRSDDRGQSWQSLGGPGPYLVATAQSDARTVWIASRSNGFGVMKSVNSGQSFSWSLREDCSGSGANYQSAWLERLWTPCWPGSPQTLAVGPNDPEAVLTTDSARTLGTFNGGATWKALYSRSNTDGTVSSTGLDVTTTYGVHVDPFDPNHLVISYTDIGMFQSHDHGASWKMAVGGIPGGWLNTGYWLVFDPEVQGRAWSVWASSHDLPLSKMWSQVRGASGGVAKTEDGLATWVASSSGLPSGAATHVELDPTSPKGHRTLYVTVFAHGVYKSVDDGNTWASANNGISHTGAWDVARAPDGTLYYVAAYFEGPGAVYLSTDGAASWHPLTLPAGVSSPRALVPDPKHPGRVYLTAWTDGGSKGGVYATEDQGQTWTTLFDPRYQVYGLAIDPRSSDVLWVTTFWGQAFRSEDRGQTWKKLTGYDFKWAHRPIIDPADPDSIYVTTFGSSVWHGP